MTSKFISSAILVAFVVVAFPVFAETAATTPDSTTSSTVLTCMQQAVEKRETAIGVAVAAYTPALTAAFQKRHTDLTAAWKITDKKARRVAIKDAWKAWKASTKKARADFKTSRRAAWKQFRTDTAACKGSAGEESVFGGSHEGENAIGL